MLSVLRNCHYAYNGHLHHKILIHINFVVPFFFPSTSRQHGSGFIEIVLGFVCKESLNARF